MEVAFLSPYLFRFARGIERYTICLANALATRGAKVTILTWAWPNPVQISSLSADIRVVQMPYLRYYRAWMAGWFYGWHLIYRRYDAVIAYWANYGEARGLKLASLRWQQPLTLVLHFPYSQVPHRYNEFLAARFHHRARYIVAVSRFVAEEAEALFGRPCTVIPHGVDNARFYPDEMKRRAIRYELGLNDETVLLITVAALEERKGVQWVLQALPQVLDKYPKVHYLVVGDGPYRSCLEEMVHESGLDGSVTFIGAQADVAPYLQAADIFLILAQGEASSLAGLEAMATQVPVIAAQRRPFDELIKAEWGILVNEKDPTAVAQAILSLALDPQRREQMGIAGREYVMQAHTWDTVAEQYLSLWSQ